MVMFLLKDSLKLICHAENSNLMKELLGFTLRHAESPTSSLQVFLVFPDGTNPLAEDMHRISEPDLVPWVVVVDSVEGRNVGDVFVKDVQSIIVVGGVGVLVIPDCPVILERQRTELPEDVLMQ